MSATTPQRRIAYSRRIVRRFAEELEVWAREAADGDAAELADLIDDLNREFDRILDIDTAARERYVGGAAFDSEFDRAVSELMRDWATIARGVVTDMDRLVPRDDHPDAAAQLRVNVAEGEAMAAAALGSKPPTDAMAALRDQAVEADRAGLTLPGLVDE